MCPHGRAWRLSESLIKSSRQHTHALGQIISPDRASWLGQGRQEQRWRGEGSKGKLGCLSVAYTVPTEDGADLRISQLVRDAPFEFLDALPRIYTKQAPARSGGFGGGEVDKFRLREVRVDLVQILVVRVKANTLGSARCQARRHLQDRGGRGCWGGRVRARRSGGRRARMMRRDGHRRLGARGIWVVERAQAPDPAPRSQARLPLKRDVDQAPLSVVPSGCRSTCLTYSATSASGA